MLTFSLNKTDEEVFGVMPLINFNPNNQLDREWVGETFLNAVRGGIDVDGVNVSAYGYVCDMNTTMAKAKKEVALITADEVSMGVRGVADFVASYVDDNIDSLIETSEFKYHVEQFVEMRDYLLVEEGVDLWTVLKLARDFNEKAMTRLRNLISTYKMEDLIKCILGTNGCFEVLSTRM